MTTKRLRRRDYVSEKLKVDNLVKISEGLKYLKMLTTE